MIVASFVKQNCLTLVIGDIRLGARSQIGLSLLEIYCVVCTYMLAWVVEESRI